MTTCLPSSPVAYPAAMSLRLFLAFLALGSSGYLGFRDSQVRPFAYAAAGVAGVLVLLYLKSVHIRIDFSREILWAGVAVLGALVWLRQQGKLGTTLAAVVTLSGALALALGIRMLRF
jgi:hypothetical protein